jgi:hypothetical protein
MADVLAETQGADGSWGDGDEALTGVVAAALVAMADAVEARAAVDEVLAQSAEEGE